MSTTPLLDKEHYTADHGWHDDFRIYREIEGKFQDVGIVRRMEWAKPSGKLRRDYTVLKRDGDTWESVQIDAKGASWDSPADRYVIRLMSSSELELDVADRKMDMFRIGLAHAKELQRMLDTGESTPPALHESGDYWTDLLTGEHHKRGTA